tara:strand:+ start:1246 stop:2280 length:1035 start_codon:yes stop_codon:yes gene_type:complete
MAKATVDTKPFVDLPTTEEFILFPEDNPGTIPLDHGRLEHLRSMSPFVLRLNPPYIGEYIKGKSQTPFSGVQRSNGRIPSLQNKEVAMFKPNLPTYALRPIDGARRNENNELVQDAGVTDRDQIRSIMEQHRRMLELPPIVFAINPNSIQFNYTDRQGYADVTRYGFIFHRWGEEQTEITINCTIGAFIAGRDKLEVPDFDGNIQGISGLQYVSRRDSLAFRNLTSILALYRNSATLVDLLGRSRAYHAVGTQCIHYDGQTWEGRLKSMEFSLNDDQQHGGLEFSLSFTVFKHTQEGFEYKPQLFPMKPPSPSANQVGGLGQIGDDLGDIAGEILDPIIGNVGG